MTPRELLAKTAEDAAAAAWVAQDERNRLRRTVLAAVNYHGVSEAEAARLAGVSRTTVREWRRQG